MNGIRVSSGAAYGVGLTLPLPRVDVPTLKMFRAALTSRAWIAAHAGQVHFRTSSGISFSL